jgi:hypothetical protein
MRPPLPPKRSKAGGERELVPEEDGGIFDARVNPE